MRKILCTILFLLFIAGCSNALPDKELENFNITALNFDEENMADELRETLNMIQEAYDRGDLEYKGKEETNGGDTLYKLTFTDAEIKSGVWVLLSPNRIQLEFENQYIIEGIAKNIHKELKDLDEEELKSSLRDPNIKNSLLKRLITRNNATIIPQLDKLQNGFEWCDSPMGGFKVGKDSPKNLTDLELAQLLSPIIQNSEALVESVLCDARDSQGKIASFDMRILPLGDLKKNHQERL